LAADEPFVKAFPLLFGAGVYVSTPPPSPLSIVKVMLLFDNAVFVYGLKDAVEFNNRGGRVCHNSGSNNGRVGVEMLFGAQRVWVKPENLRRIYDAFDLHESFYDEMSGPEKLDMQMYLSASKDAKQIPGIRGVSISTDCSDKEYAALVDDEKMELLRVGQWGCIEGHAEFRHVVEKINMRRGGLGNYAKDWGDLVVNGNLFRMHGHRASSGLQVGGPELLRAIMKNTPTETYSDYVEFNGRVQAVFRLNYPTYAEADKIADECNMMHGAEYGSYAHNLLRNMFNNHHESTFVNKAGCVMFEIGGRQSMQCNFYNYRCITMDMAKMAQIDEHIYMEWWGDACVAINRAWEGIGGWVG